MILDLDPIYHTETMVHILREQGLTLQVSELETQCAAGGSQPTLATGQTKKNRILTLSKLLSRVQKKQADG